MHAIIDGPRRWRHPLCQWAARPVCRIGAAVGVVGRQDPARRDDANQTFPHEFYLDASAQVKSAPRNTTMPSGRSQGHGAPRQVK